MQKEIMNTENLTVMQTSVDDLILDDYKDEVGGTKLKFVQKKVIYSKFKFLSVSLLFYF